ncbi:hypothetical protein quinque_004841 [Culex quinquefasciatus]|uniref:uncharacterized protein LOC119769967 isoform X1 n=1 Tax=Culex quinquefasciatus TaxID=7176 RepID=UPI0018E29D2B|nr:uncharacterized protein LOC119769967 isoform X1 [Culex quinquefasciatus]
MNPQESQKLEMYILLCQCSHALITSLMNASKRCSPYVQVAIRQRMFQLAESLRLFLSGTPDRSLRAGGGHGSRLDRSLDVSRGSERGAASRHDVMQDDLNASVATNPEAALTQPGRFPMLQSLLKSLASSADDSVLTVAVHPYAHVPNFATRVLQEMEDLNQVFQSDQTPQEMEAVVSERLARMEDSINHILLHLDRLEELQK